MRRADVDVVTTDVPERKRYEARVDGELAGFADYLPTDELVAFTHTEVLPAFEGNGVAKALIADALDDVRRKGLAVLAVCPYVTRFLQQHAEQYGDLVYRSRTRDALD